MDIIEIQCQCVQNLQPKNWLAYLWTVLYRYHPTLLVQWSTVPAIILCQDRWRELFSREQRIFLRNEIQINCSLYCRFHFREHLIEQNRKQNEVHDQVRKRSHSSDRSTDNSMMSSNESTAMNTEEPPADLLCPLCKNVFVDAVVTPCCQKGFCDECNQIQIYSIDWFLNLEFLLFIVGIRNTLIQNDELQCPLCQQTNVEVDQLNPSPSLRLNVDRWREEQQRKSSCVYADLNYSSENFSKSPSSAVDLEGSMSGFVSVSMNRNSNDSPTGLNTEDQNNFFQPKLEEEEQQKKPTSVPGKQNPIVIRMQPAPIQNLSPPSKCESNKPESNLDDQRTSEHDQSSAMFHIFMFHPDLFDWFDFIWILF